LRLIPS
jgi:chromosome segregation ATPase